ncbi:MAG: alpha/beta hydrolase [Bacteroidetes bacterium]|nr:alpha/beta hydrolase [Bacteroidota bacterium]
MKSRKESNSIYKHGNPLATPIVFIHGFPYDHNMWDKQISFLQNSYFCISYDIRGLGNSPAGDGQFTMESFVDDLEEIIDELKLDKPVLCGLSMGGYIVLRAVERIEGQLGGLILCDTKSEADTNEVKLKRAAGIKKINDEGVQKFVEDFVPTCFTEESIRSLTEYKETLARSLKSDPIGVKGCLLAMQGRTDTTSYLSKIKIPALVLCGEEDKLSPPSSMKSMSEKINSAEFVVIPDAAHMTQIENPEAVNKAFLSFLKRNFV